jgi:hypothetical protein
MAVGDAAPTTTAKILVTSHLYLIMSSGFGLKGTVGRCYPFFADYKDCLVSGTKNNEEKYLKIRREATN